MNVQYRIKKIAGSRRSLPTCTAVLILALWCFGLPLTATASNDVPAPTVTGPIEGGLRGWAYGVTANDPEAFGYVAREYFIEGVARASSGEAAPYKTRILVLGPIDARHYRGSVIVEWLNVSSQQEVAPVWYATHEHLIREGYAYVAVSAQKAGVDGSPLALKFWDPVRYGDLSHPGDEYSFDIYSQVAQALRRGKILENTIDQPDPLQGLNPRRLLASGHSQSGSRLVGYINDFHEAAGLFEGFLPLGFELSNVRDDLDPVFGVYGEWAASPGLGGIPRPDGGNFLVWEVAGAAHGSWWTVSYGSAAGTRNRAGPGSGDYFDRDAGAQYGEEGGGPCPQNFFPDRYAWNAALSHLERWVREGIQPPGADRIKRDPLTERLVRDADGNVVGGMRLPPIDVPVATYTGNSCELLGDTRAFDPIDLSQRYRTHEAYVAAMRAATVAALEAGYLLAPDAEELMSRVRASSIGGPLVEN